MDEPKLSPEAKAILARMQMPNKFDPATVARRKTDIPYGTLPEQLLDVYYPPEGQGPWPLILYIHGGGWTLGNRRECALEGIIDAIHSGYAIVSVDYRLAPKVKYPEFLFDVKTAVRWARANAAEFDFDPARFAVMGDSAGAHLALLIGFTAGHPECEGEQYGWPGVSSAVQAVVDIYGPADLAADNAAWVAEAGVPTVRFFGAAEDDDGAPLDRMMACFTPDRDMLPFISPIAYVHRDIPPVLILQGEADPVVPKQHSIHLAQRITEVCGPERVDLRLYPERTHADFAFLTDETAHTVVGFLDNYLK